MPPLRRILAAACVLAIMPHPARSAPELVLEHRSPDGTITRETLPPGHALSQIAGPGGVLRSRSVDPRAPIRVIVEFQAPPAVTARRLGLDAALPARSLDRLRRDLARLASASRAGSAGVAPEANITHAYTQVFSGAAVTLAPALLDRVRSLDYVRRVVQDDSVRAVLDESVPLIGADRVRNQLGGTGAGIRVGVIDTGIDYTHAALGGGFGPGHRVAGGWDFVSDDPDPRDDNGHGTHVAGIVAGNGDGVVGVAPEATLYAFKVLDQHGVGYQSWVLAGLERVLDPDQNPATDDAMQVINVSIGGEGDADDPLALAVDHLTEAGVVCAVAAGNWPWYFGINSPGTSRRAITVGASTKSDAIAVFSSLGPAPGGFDLKPDLVAPGENIVSAAIGGGRIANSGTSMATPHVAGVAAQIRQLHPQWTPEEVKAALVGTAKPLQRSSFVQGAGRLDAYRAATAGFVVSPTHLSFGRADGEVPTWSRTQTLHVTNLSAAGRTVSFLATDFSSAMARLRVTPVEIDVRAGGSADVEVTLEVDNAATPFPPHAPFGYDATLLASSGGESHRIPVTFHKAATLSVASSSWIDWLIVHDRSFGGFIASTSRLAPIVLPPGTYDVMASFYNYVGPFVFVVREGVPVSGDAQVALDPSLATAHLDFANVGPDGAPLTCDHGLLGLYDTRSGWGFNYIGFPFDQVWSSPASSTYRLDWVRTQLGDHGQRISASGGLIGVVGSRTFTNHPEDLHQVAMHFPAPAAQAIPLIWDYVPFHPDLGGYFGFGWIDSAQPIAGPYTDDFWFMPGPYEGHIQLGHRVEMRGDLGQGQPLERGPLLRLDRGWPVEGYFSALSDPPWFTFGGKDLWLGVGMPVWRGRFANAQQTLWLDAGPYAPVHVFSDLYGGVFSEPDPHFTVREPGSPTAVTDTMRGAGGLDTFVPILHQLSAAGECEVRVSREYRLRGRSARLDVDAHMDTRRGDPNPPWLQSLHLFADGAATDSIAFDSARDAGLRFVMTDDGTVTPHVTVRSGSAWIDLTIERRLLPRSQGDEFLARLPSTLKGPIAIRLVAEDDSGNSLTLTWDPALIAVPGSLPGGAALALAGIWPNPAPAGPLFVNFTLSASSKATLALYDLTGREVATHQVGPLGPGDHVFDVAAGKSLRSGIYFVRLAQDGRVLTSRVCVIQ